MSSEGALDAAARDAPPSGDDAPLWFLYNPHRPLGLSMAADGCRVTSMDPRSQLCSQLGAHPALAAVRARTAAARSTLVGWRLASVDRRAVATTADVKREIAALRARDAPVAYVTFRYDWDHVLEWKPGAPAAKADDDRANTPPACRLRWADTTTRPRTWRARTSLALRKQLSDEGRRLYAEGFSANPPPLLNGREAKAASARAAAARQASSLRADAAKEAWLAQNPQYEGRS